MMKSFLLAAALASSPAWAESPMLLATWSENSGSLPPPYAWNVSAQVFADRSVTVQYCKGYADTEPGCATVMTRADDVAMAELLAVLKVNTVGLTVYPPHAMDDPPVGGGSVHGSVTLGDVVIDLPAFPSAVDQARVTTILAAIRAVIPTAALQEAAAKAIGPKED